MQFPTQPGESKYIAYTNYISELCKQCGYKVEHEFLRIPSPKNIAIVGQSCMFDPSKLTAILPIINESNEIYTRFANTTLPDADTERAQDVLRAVQQKIDDATITFIPRVPDNIKNEIQMEKQRTRYQQIET